MKLQRWIKTLLIVLIMAFMIAMIKHLDNGFVKDCVSAGYSEEYCINHK